MVTALSFWRDLSLPFIEARIVPDGREVHYDKHSHDVFSVGAITSGRSVYWNEDQAQEVSTGTVVLMNAGDVHACNPIQDSPWSYIMFYVDVEWLKHLQKDLGVDVRTGMQRFETRLSRDPVLFQALTALYATCTDVNNDVLLKQTAVFDFFILLHQVLKVVPELRLDTNPKLKQAADFIAQHCTENLSLNDICAASGLSPSYLIRAFKRQYGMTPHAHMVNRRILFAQQQLKAGQAIADVALAAGFADQAHFQRIFKRLVAATPRQYSTSIKSPSTINTPHSWQVNMPLSG